MDIRIKKIRATGDGGNKKSHPAVIHFLVEELRSLKGSSDGLSLQALADFLTAKGYTVRKMQLHGMVYSTTDSHYKKVDEFQKLLDEGNEDAEAQLAHYLGEDETSAA
jgi:hypothetical protein